MQIVINVDNELYEYFSKRRTMHDDGYFSHIGKLIKAFRDGSILPKGHGRLIDANELLESKIQIIDEIGTVMDVVEIDIINDTPTIIEADK